MPTGSRRRSSGPSEPGGAPPWAQLRAGVLLLAGLILASLAVFFLDIVARELSAGPRLVVTAAEARDLVPGAPVWVAGVPAGRVGTIRFLPPRAAGERRVLIRARLREGAGDVLRADASAAVRAPALLEPAVLAIRPGSASAPLDVSDTLRAEPQIDRREVMARADSLASRLTELGPVARRLARRLREGPGTVAALRGDTAAARRLEAALRAGARLGRTARDGSAARLAADSSLHARWRRIAERSGRIGASAGEAAELAGVLDRLTGRLARLRGRMDSARGTVGRLLHDEALRRERSLLEARMDSVRAELLADPLRWLRFRLY